MRARSGCERPGVAGTFRSRRRGRDRSASASRVDRRGYDVRGRGARAAADHRPRGRPTRPRGRPRRHRRSEVRRPARAPGRTPRSLPGDLAETPCLRRGSGRRARTCRGEPVGASEIPSWSARCRQRGSGGSVLLEIRALGPRRRPRRHCRRSRAPRSSRRRQTPRPSPAMRSSPDFARVRGRRSAR